jgi:hypothetical protein
MPESKNILLIFTKNPVLGRVKTRLAKTLGDEAALEAFIRLRSCTFRAAEQVPCTRWMCYSDFIPEHEDHAQFEMYETALQSGSDLGIRMANMFQRAFEAGGEHVMIVGTDCPGITAEILSDGFKKLESADCVLGPSEDGGYYLLGMKSFMPRLFSDMTWSTDTVAEITANRIREDGKTLEYLTTLRDVDTETDWWACQHLL